MQRSALINNTDSLSLRASSENSFLPFVMFRLKGESHWNTSERGTLWVCSDKSNFCFSAGADLCGWVVSAVEMERLTQFYPQLCVTSSYTQVRAYWMVVITTATFLFLYAYPLKPLIYVLLDPVNVFKYSTVFDVMLQRGNNQNCSHFSTSIWTHFLLMAL